MAKYFELTQCEYLDMLFIEQNLREIFTESPGDEKLSFAFGSVGARHQLQLVSFSTPLLIGCNEKLVK